MRAFISAWQGVRHLTDPASSHKACVESSDAAITKTIHDVSKGSKFYENQRARHTAVSEKIARVRRRRDEALHAIECSGTHADAQARVDRVAADLELHRDLSRTVLHCDMDMFYAAVELQHDPSLEGKCFAVGKGVLLTSSYEARRHGVRSGQAEFVGRAVCPELIVVPSHFDWYRASSAAIMAIFRTYDAHMVQRSLDEAYLDVTEYCAMRGMDVGDVVAQLRGEVLTTTGLTVSVGIAPNMLLAKIASDRRKPNGQYQVVPDRTEILAFVRSLPVRSVPGIGHVTERILDALGVDTCGALWQRRLELSLCMDNFSFLLASALGIGPSRVQAATREERKSVGRENTFTPTAHLPTLHRYLYQACTQLAQDLVDLSFRARTVSLIGKHDTFERFTRARSVGMAGVASVDELFELAKTLLAQETAAHRGPMPLRLIGVRGTALVNARTEKSSLQQWLHNQGPVHACPICDQAIAVPRGGTAAQVSTAVNRHVDACLGIAPESPPSTLHVSPTAPREDAPKRARRSTLDAFFTRSSALP